ncbi:hypothetical protein CHUAL_007360 [Chamberlinius hualienensis]
MDDVKLCELVEKHPYLYDATNEFYKDTNVRDKVWKEISEILIESVLDDCKNRWRNIRDTYYRRLRIDKKLGDSAAKKRKLTWRLQDKISFLASFEPEKRVKYNVLSSHLECQNENSESSHITDDDGSKSPEDVEASVETWTDVDAPLDICTNVETASKVSVVEWPHPINLKFVPKKPKLDLKVVDVVSLSPQQNIQKSSFQIDSISDPDPLDSFFLSMAASIQSLPTEMQLQAKLDILKYVSELELQILHQNFSQQTMTTR